MKIIKNTFVKVSVDYTGELKEYELVLKVF
jgi:hypothetical protein